MYSNDSRTKPDFLYNIHDFTSVNVLQVQVNCINGCASCSYLEIIQFLRALSGITYVFTHSKLGGRRGGVSFVVYIKCLISRDDYTYTVIDF